jgi:trimeric autotransporter adhesin
LKPILLIGAAFLFCTNVWAQSPVITYSPATNNLLLGVPFYIAPTNTGGAVPATVYGTVGLFAGSTTNRAGILVDGTGTAARFNDMEGMGADAAGNIYVAESAGNDVRKITPAGVVTTFASDTKGINANLNSPDGVAVDLSGNVYIANYGGNRADNLNEGTIVKITPGGLVSTFATMAGPSGLSFDASGNLWVADQIGNTIKEYSPTGSLLTSVGSGTYAYADGTGLAASFANPSDVQVDPLTGNIIAVDYQNNAIRMVTPAGVVTTIAGNPLAPGNGYGYADGIGTAALFGNPTGVVNGNGNVIYIMDHDNHVIRRIMPGVIVTTIAGSTGQSNTINGIGTAAGFDHPVDMTINNAGTGFIIDGANNNIRTIVLTGYTIDKALPAGLSFDVTTGIISGSPTATFASTTYTITGFNTSGFSIATITLSCTAAIVNNWTGAGTSGDWGNAGNWSLGVPTATQITEIGVTAYTGTFQPVLSASSTVQSIVFGANNTPSLTINSGQALTVSAGLTVNASSAATINGPGTISITGNSSILPSASLTASSNAIISLGPSTLLTNYGTFTLTSDLNGSASIAAIPFGSGINGIVSVQRYLGALRGYRLASSPVNSGSQVSYSVNYVKNSLFVLGTTGTAAGFDGTSSADNLDLYREDVPVCNTSFTCGNFRGINNLLNGTGTTPTYTIDGDPSSGYAIPVGTGFQLFTRGDKTAGLAAETVPGFPATFVTLTATGTLNQGQVVFKNWYNGSSYLGDSNTDPRVGGFNLVGNPYASTIDMSTANGNISQTTGVYAPGVAFIYEYNASSKSYDVYPLANPSMRTGNASQYIASGQGFFILAPAVNTPLIFNESAKVPTQQVTGANSYMSSASALATAINAGNNAQALPYLKLKIALDTINNFEMFVAFKDSAKTTFDRHEDAPYMASASKAILYSLSSDNVSLVINQLPALNKQPKIIPLNMIVGAYGTFTISLDAIQSIPQLYDVLLIDNYNKDTTSLRRNPLYPFAVISGDTGSYSKRRFNLMVRQNPVYAYQLLNFTASKMPGSHRVEADWKTANEQNYTNFTVERSIDGGKTFSVIGGLPGTGAGAYSLIDNSPFTGQNLYRLKQEDINSTITYSQIVPIIFGDKDNSDMVQAYPNPAKQVISLNITPVSLDNTAYDIIITNSTGFVVKQAVSTNTVWSATVSELVPGTYLVKVLNQKDKSLVGQTKFVKL